MLEYSLIIISTVLFGGQFIALNAYQDKNGKIYRSIFLFCILYSALGAFTFVAANAFKLSFSWYTLLYASIAGFIQLILQIAGIKALSLGRVEVYTLFNVAGGMSVSYVFGVTYFNEPIYASHIIGLVLILLALLVPIISDRKSKQKSRIIFWVLCFLVFMANGMFGVVNKMHIVSYQGLSIREYMFYMYVSLCFMSLISFGVINIFVKGKGTKELFNVKGSLFALLYGALNSVGMVLQYSYADKVPASILFPLSNGGALAFGLLIGCIAYKKKPTIPDIIQFVIAVIGMVFFVVSF